MKIVQGLTVRYGAVYGTSLLPVGRKVSPRNRRRVRAISPLYLHAGIKCGHLFPLLPQQTGPSSKISASEGPAHLGLQSTNMSTGTQIINKYCQGNKSKGKWPHQQETDIYECDGHTDSNPKWGCKLFIDGILRGHVVNCGSKQLAKEGACDQAVEALGLEDN